MKIDQRRNLIEEDNGLQLEGHSAGLDANNLGLIFELFSNIYQDTFGSIVREITSNAVDAHIEKDVVKPVIINNSKDDGGEFISFQDFGNGMNPEFIEKTFINYFSSTKRLSDAFIGGFGIN